MNTLRKTVSEANPANQRAAGGGAGVDDLQQTMRRQSAAVANNARNNTQRPVRPGQPPGNPGIGQGGGQGQGPGGQGQGLGGAGGTQRRGGPPEEVPSLVYKYRIRSKIGGGSFGSIHKAVHVHTGEEVAIKLEAIKANLHQLSSERNIYQIIAGGVGVPTMKWYGSVENYNALVMDLLGPSLEDVFNYCRRSFTLKTILMIAEQMLQRIEYVHSKNYIHRDIKPENFVTGLNKKGATIHLIDFGLAKRYRDPGTHLHIPWKGDKKLTGTARYASVNTHMGSEQSRRDDIESIGYVLVYLSKGRLPWQGINGKTDQEKYKLIGETKKNTDVAALCNGLPEEFTQYMKYARELKFEEKPDYSFLRRLFRQLFIREAYHYDGLFDWIVKYQKSTSTALYNHDQITKAMRADRHERPPKDRPPGPDGRPANGNVGGVGGTGGGTGGAGGGTGGGTGQLGSSLFINNTNNNTGTGTNNYHHNRTNSTLPATQYFQNSPHAGSQNPNSSANPAHQKRGILNLRSRLNNWISFRKSDKKKDKDKDKEKEDDKDPRKSRRFE